MKDYRLQDAPFSSSGGRLRTAVAWLAALLALADILWVALVTVSMTHSWGDSLWPLPGLYLLEWLALGGGCLFAIATAEAPHPTWVRALPWIGAGIMLAFNVLGVFSIGLPLLPATLGMLLAGAVSRGRPAARWLVTFPLSALLQAALMLLLAGAGP